MPSAASHRVAFGQRIAALRRAIGLTQEDLAARAGLSSRYVSRVELGRVNVSLEVMHQLARGLRVRAELLVDGPEGREQTEREVAEQELLAALAGRPPSDVLMVARMVRAMFGV